MTAYELQEEGRVVRRAELESGAHQILSPLKPDTLCEHYLHDHTAHDIRFGGTWPWLPRDLDRRWPLAAVSKQAPQRKSIASTSRPLPCAWCTVDVGVIVLVSNARLMLRASI